MSARCRFLGPDTFFADDGETTGEKIRRERAARAICGPCPVRQDCASHALTYQEHGVWGGTTESDRNNERRVLRGGPNRRSGRGGQC
ncbi:WhiB family transcriptional regulator [Rhodococcus opacus]|uniref:WhiB family transcriptional regulator n=1 Tax=Rhodococcus opacus TaxID=37919 RepID=UPI0009BD324C|nr:WhiB family transcriptional regulator [Rhodococcus opacus]MDJ0419068.1 WhiB family transcriptional regulator [Rhodococcus opacus]MDX5965499.1 WhiB family transcriptional regulator [Rhodococcus opacus]NKY74010.1 WhiB family transcriptional regulator [Rhodococcus opacus]